MLDQPERTAAPGNLGMLGGLVGTQGRAGEPLEVPEPPGNVLNERGRDEAPLEAIGGTEEVMGGQQRDWGPPGEPPETLGASGGLLGEQARDRGPQEPLQPQQQLQDWPLHKPFDENIIRWAHQMVENSSQTRLTRNKKREKISLLLSQLLQK